MLRTDTDWLDSILRSSVPADVDTSAASGSASRFEGLYGRGYSAVIRNRRLRGLVARAWGGAEALRDLDEIFARVAAETPADGAPILDVPCGQGVAAHLLDGAGWNGRLIGIDLARLAVERARAQAHGIRVDARYLRGDALDLPLREGSVGAIVSINGLHVMPDQARFLGELARVLAPGGSCWLVTMTSTASLRTRAIVAAGRALGILPRRPPTPPELKQLVQAAGFRVAEHVAGSRVVALRLEA